jgi:hypothetical protein
MIVDYVLFDLLIVSVLHKFSININQTDLLTIFCAQDVLYPYMFQMVINGESSIHLSSRPTWPDGFARFVWFFLAPT